MCGVWMLVCVCDVRACGCVRVDACVWRVDARVRMRACGCVRVGACV